MNQTNRACMYYLLAEPVVARVEVLHAGRGVVLLGHANALFIVLKECRGSSLRNAKIGKKMPGADSIASGFEGSQVLGMGSAGGHSGLTTTGVVDARTREERAVPSRGATIVKRSTVVGQEVTVDVVVEGLVGVAEDDAGIGVRRYMS